MPKRDHNLKSPLVDNEYVINDGDDDSEKAPQTFMERMRAIKFTRETWTLVALLVGLVVIGSANNVLSKLMYNTYSQKYAFFVNQMVNVLYIILSGIAYLWKRCLTNDITPEMTQFPKRKFAFMAFLDALASFLAAMGAVYTPGQFQTLLNQTIIPVTMVAAYVFLRTRFPAGQLSGAFIVLVGACVAVVPSFVNPSDATQSRWYSVLIYFTSNIPTALSSVYKEYGFKEQLLDVYYLTMYVTCMQFAIGFLFAPIQALPGFGGVAMSDIPQEFWGGLKCFVGINSHPDDTCGNAGMIMLIYTAVNFVYNIIGLFITKLGSAVLTSIAYAVRLPLTNIAYTIRLFMGKYTEKFTPFNIAGLIVTFFGFCVYTYFEPPEEDDEEEEEGKPPMVKPFLSLPPQSQGFEISKDTLNPGQRSPRKSKARSIYGTSVPNKSYIPVDNSDDEPWPMSV